MTNNEFNHIELSEILFKSSDVLATDLISILTGRLFFTQFINFKKFIAAQHYFNELLFFSLTHTDTHTHLDRYISSVKSHSDALIFDITRFRIHDNSAIKYRRKVNEIELAGWLYVYYFCDYFSSYYFKEINNNIEDCATKKYLMKDSLIKKSQWNLFNNFLNKNYYGTEDKKAIIEAIKKYSNDYLQILSESTQ